MQADLYLCCLHATKSGFLVFCRVVLLLLTFCLLLLPLWEAVIVLSRVFHDAHFSAF